MAIEHRGERSMTTSNASSLHLPPGRRILVVDDEPVIRRIVDFALSGAGYAVFEAEDAMHAVQAVRTAAPTFDLVLLDLTLSDGDGATIIPVIRRHSPGTRVLVVSGLGAMDAAEIGADGYLAKPFTKAALLDAVENALGSAMEKPQGR